MIYIEPEIRQQFLWRLKRITEFEPADMLVIAFAGFVVVTKYTLAIYDIGKRIFILVVGTSHLLRNQPNPQLRKSPVIKIVPLAEERFCLHVGERTND